jgi:hypothetical protein
MALVQNGLPGTSLDLVALAEAAGVRTQKERLSQFATLLLGQPLPARLADGLLPGDRARDERVLLAALLGSPAFQWK